MPVHQAQTLPIRCQCGSVSGTLKGLTPGDYHRLVCYCHDCQAYARFLKQEAAVLDPWGGSDIVQVAPAQLQITSGQEAIRCLRLSEKGMYRFYAGCCQTPIANAAGPRIPFAGVLRVVIGKDSHANADDPLAPPRSYALGRDAKPGAPKHIHSSLPPRTMLYIARLLFRWWRSGRGVPSPFFRDGQPICMPQVLSESARQALGD